MKKDISEIEAVLNRVNLSCLGNSSFRFRIERDPFIAEWEELMPIWIRRIFIQIVYQAPCTKTGESLEWKGRKFYLSDYMTNQEILGTAYLAFKLAIEHEIMEGFKVDGKVLFNPHVSFESLLSITENEITRDILPQTEKSL